jgi:hypothetical protein
MVLGQGRRLTLLGALSDRVVPCAAGARHHALIAFVETRLEGDLWIYSGDVPDREPLRAGLERAA